jgi:hypothetical protein
MALATATLATLPSAGNFTASAGSLLDAVSSVGGEYGISAATSGQLYGTIADFGLTGETINAVRVLIRGRLAASGSRDLAAGLTIGSLNYAPAQYLTDTGWADYLFEWLTNPSTGSPWTPAEVDSITRVYCRCAATSGTTIAHIDYLQVQVDYGSGSETKTAATTVSLDLGTSGGGSKTAHSGAALDLDLGTDSDPAKTGHTAAALAALLDLTSAAAKTGRSATSLSMLLGLDTDTTKRAAAATGIDLTLALSAASDLPPEHHTAAATLGLGLALDAIAGKTAATGATLALTLASHAGATKTGVAHVDLGLILEALAAAHKTGGAQTVLDLALAIAAAHYTPAGATPPERTLVIAADDRVITITADDRTLTIDRQDRTITIGAT